MLQELTIQNFAIIPELAVSFAEGMTVLTGETGAGKSIIIDAVGLLVGGRGSIDYIREGSSKCLLEGQFNVTGKPELRAILSEAAIEQEDETLILSREIYRNGKNTCRINGRLVNTAKLREVGAYLVDIHGQNEHQELMHADNHLHLLDQFGGAALGKIKANYLESFRQYSQTLKKVANQQNNEKEFAQRVDMLVFQCEEIGGASLVVGEEATLIEERNKLNNFQKIVTSLKNTHEALEGGEASSIDRIGFAMNELLEIEMIDQEYADYSEAVKNSYYQLQEVASQVSRSIDSLELDEARLNQIESRLDTIRQLKRKYGESEDAILTYYAEISAELAASKSAETVTEELAHLLIEQKKNMEAVAQSLSALRQGVARELEGAILTQLTELYMEKTRFEIKFKAEEEQRYTETGRDRVEFYITTNPGEPLKPLVKVASGGELSRVMLALKTIFSRTQGMTSIVFDEVDTGVSGRVAQAIANKIHQIATNSQVLCITHLPQVAAVADSQYYIAKAVVGQRTETTLKKLSSAERVMEVARMLSGETITPLTKEHARELLAFGNKK